MLGTYGDNKAGVFLYDAEEEAGTQVGANLEGEGVDDVIDQVSLSGDGKRVAIASTWKIRSYVYVYAFNSGDWVQLGQKLAGQELDDEFGASISLSLLGDRLAIGSPARFNDIKGVVRAYELELIDNEDSPSD